MTPLARGRSLQTVLMTTFMVGLVIILVFVMVSVVPRVSQMLQQSAVERTKETVMQGVHSVELYLSSALSALHYASSLVPEDPAASLEQWAPRLDLMRASRGDVTALAFFLEDGSLLYGTDGPLRRSPEQVRQTPWFQKALGWQGTVTYFSPPHVQDLFENQRRFVITLSRSLPYTQEGQQKLGVMLMDLDYLAFSQVLNAVPLGESGYVYLMDDQGRLVTHPRLQQIYAGLAVEDRAAVLRQQVGTTEDRIAGRDRTLIVGTVSPTRWRLVGVAYAEEILSLQAQFLRTVFIVAGAGALLSLGAALLMAYAVTRPIRTLESTMRRVEEGNLDVRIKETGFREIRGVAGAFNHMLRRIRLLMDQVVVEQETKRLHELNALQAQINPHFLYNTLDSIIWMEERGRSQQAITMVSALARLFRISISRGRNEIAVHEELEHVRNYLIIQQMRFKDRFTYRISCEEEAREKRTIKLILQPLVENALNHAMDELDQEQLHIQVLAFMREDSLCLQVKDNGLGIPEDRLATLLSAPVGTSGIGLKNVHERIQLTYGRAYGLTIHSVEDQGTVVTVRLPGNGEETS